MAIKPMSSAAIRQILKDQGVDTLDDLLKKLDEESKADPTKSAYNVVEPLASWVIKVFRLDATA